MSFNDGVGLDTSQVQSGGSGGGPGGMAVGGGLGGIILLILGLIFGIPMGNESPAAPSSQEQVDGSSTSGEAFERCKTGADANADVECRVIGTVNSVQAYWTETLPRYQREWQPTKTVLYKGSTPSQCGTASNQVGPFYCPLDQKIYIDADFFAILEQQFGSDGGALAQEYVVAHEYGHALQDQLNLLGRAQQDQQEPTAARSGSSSWPTASPGSGQRRSTPRGPTAKPSSAAHRRRHQECALCCRGRGRRPHPGEDAGTGQPRGVDPRQRRGATAVVPAGLQDGDLNQCNTFDVDRSPDLAAAVHDR